MLYVVCGYPASGKSTYCHALIQTMAGAIVFDMDAMRAALTIAGPHDERMGHGVGRMLNDIAHWMERFFAGYDIPDMFLIRMAPTDKEMGEYIGNEDVRVILIDTPKEICLERAKLRGDFDLYAFGRACGRVDRFVAAHGDHIIRASPPSLPPPFH